NAATGIRDIGRDIGPDHARVEPQLAAVVNAAAILPGKVRAAAAQRDTRDDDVQPGMDVKDAVLRATIDDRAERARTRERQVLRDIEVTGRVVVGAAWRDAQDIGRAAGQRRQDDAPTA